MSSTQQTVYLVSGANRGIGLGLVTALAKQPQNLIFAGARDPSKADALNALAEANPNVKVIQLTSADLADNKRAVAEIQKTVDHLDVVIANAGIGNYYGPLLTTPLQSFEDHYQINTIGVVALFQATHPLLVKSPTGSPHFALISTAVASISNYFSVSASAYGASKAAANFLIQTIHHEHESEGFIATAHSPGWVSTDMGDSGAKANGLPKAPVEVEDSVRGLLSHIVGATREKSSGRFWSYEQTTEIGW